MIPTRPQDGPIPGIVLAMRDQMIELLDLARFEAWVKQADEDIKFWSASAHLCPLAHYFNSEFYTDKLIRDESMNLPAIGADAIIRIHTTDHVVSVIPETFHFQSKRNPWQEIVKQVDSFTPGETVPHSSVLEIVDLVKQMDTDSTNYEIKVLRKETGTSWHFRPDGTVKGRITQ